MSEDLRVIVDADASPLVRELRRAGVEVRGFGQTVSRQSPSARAFSAALDKQKESLRGLTTFAKQGAFAIGGALALAIGHAIKTGADFESQMARVQAVTGATGKEMEKLKSLAIDLGAKTKFSAGEAAEAMYELASAGFNVQQTSKALPGTLALAAASSIDLGSAAEISSNALRGFGLATKESTHVADVLAQSVNTSSVEMEDLQLSLKYIGPVARATGETFEQMIAAVSLMGNAGIKGEQAGTSLRGGLLRLIKPTKQVNEGLETLGLSAEEVQGPHGLLPLPELVAKLQSGMDGLSRAQKSQALAQIFGTEALSGMLTVVEAGPAKLRSLTKEFENSQGASAKAAKTMNDTVAGSFDQLKGSVETFEIELFQHFEEPLKRTLLDATDFVNTQGKQLQEGLEAAMATPEFKSGDFAQRMEILANVVGEQWRKSGLQGDITEVLVDAFNFALPKIAEAAGKSAVTAAESFATGFLRSDAFGKLVIGTWLFTKFGGFAALKAAGTKAGAEIGAGMQTGLTESGAAGSSFAGGSKGAVGTGLAWGKSFLKGFGLSMVIGGGIAGLIAPPRGQDGIEKRLQNAVSGATFGLVPEAGLSIGGELASQMAEGFDKQIGPAMQRKSTRGLEGIRHDLRAVIKVGIEEGADDAELKPLRERIQRLGDNIDLRHSISRGQSLLSSGWLTSLQDLNSTFKQQLQRIDQTWDKGTKPWRQHIADNLQAAIVGIGKSMARGDISIKQGLKRQEQLLRNAKLITGEDPFGIAAGFRSSWKKAGEISKQERDRAIDDLGKMPPKARQKAFDTMVEFGRGLVRGGKLPKQDLRDFISAAITKLKGLNPPAEASSQKFMGIIGGAWGGAAEAALEALVNIEENTSNALKGFGGSKGPKISWKKLLAASKDPSKFGEGRQTGGIVPGSGDGDKVRRDVRPGTFILNREATRAFGFDRGGRVPVILEPGEREFTPEEVKRMGGAHVLEGMNQAVQRFQGGGEVQAPMITGKGPLRNLDQRAVDMVSKAAQKYLDKHRPKGGAGYTGPAFGPAGTSMYKGILMATWVRQALEYAASKGVNAQPTSGYRSHSYNVSQGRTYFSEHEKTQYPGGAVDFGGYVDPAAATVRDAVVAATRDFKYPLLHPIGFRDDGHASGTGHMLGGLIRALSVGGSVPPSTGELVGASYYGGPTDGVSGTVGAAGVSLPGKDSFAELAMGKALGGLPFHTKLKISRGGKSVIAEKLDIGLGGDDVNGHNRAIDLWYETAAKLGLNGVGVVKVSSLDGSAAGGSTKLTDAEKKQREGKARKASYEAKLKKLQAGARSARTDRSRRSALWRLIEMWGRVGIFDKDERGHILEAVQEASSKLTPGGTANVLAGLASWAENHGEVTGQDPNNYHSLTDAIANARKRGDAQRDRTIKKHERQRARKITRIASWGEFKDLVASLKDAEGKVDLASQDADRLMALEPEDVNDSYVGQERGAWTNVLGNLGGWRNKIVGAEAFASQRKFDFEQQIRNILAFKVPGDKYFMSIYEKEKWKLKPLREAVANAAGFLGDRAEEMTDLQGVGGPGGTIASLGEGTPYWLTLGGPGSRIFDTQNTIRELGIKDTGAGAADELKDLRNEQLRRELAEARLENKQFGVLQGFLGEFKSEMPYIGAFMTGTGGTRVGRSGLAMLHRDEQIVPDPKGPAGSQFASAAPASGAPTTVNLYVDGDIAPLMGKVRAEIDGRAAQVADRQIGRRRRQLAVSPGR